METFTPQGAILVLLQSSIYFEVPNLCVPKGTTLVGVADDLVIIVITKQPENLKAFIAYGGEDGLYYRSQEKLYS